MVEGQGFIQLESHDQLGDRFASADERDVKELGTRNQG
jgi:hypothetical protein